MSSRAIADTSLFIARESGRPIEPYDEGLEIAVSIVTIAELEMGLLAAAAPRIRAARLQTLRDAEQLTALRLVAGHAEEQLAAGEPVQISSTPGAARAVGSPAAARSNRSRSWLPPG